MKFSTINKNPVGKNLLQFVMKSYENHQDRYIGRKCREKLWECKAGKCIYVSVCIHFVHNLIKLMDYIVPQYPMCIIFRKRFMQMQFEACDISRI